MSNNNAKRKSARIGRAHAEVRQNPNDGSLVRFEDSVNFDLPQESAFLMTVDGLQDVELKQMMMKSYREIHYKKLEMASKAQERAESRADRALEAEIRLRDKNMRNAFVLFILVLIGFMVGVFLRIPATCLWAYGIFFLGPAGFYALAKFGSKSPQPSDGAPDNK